MLHATSEHSAPGSPHHDTRAQLASLEIAARAHRRHRFTRLEDSTRAPARYQIYTTASAEQARSRFVTRTDDSRESAACVIGDTAETLQHRPLAGPASATPPHERNGLSMSTRSTSPSTHGDVFSSASG